MRLDLQPVETDYTTSWDWLYYQLRQINAKSHKEIIMVKLFHVWHMTWLTISFIFLNENILKN